MGNHKHMRAFLKDNIAIVAAIVLPVLLAVIFVLSTGITRISVEDPKHDFLVATDYYEDNSSFLFNLENKKFSVSFRPEEKHPGGYSRYINKPRLWRVNVPEMTVEEIALTAPANGKAGPVEIPALKGLTLKNVQPGPDGYSYQSYYRYDNNFMSEIFSPTRKDRDFIALEKNGRLVRIKVPEASSWNYNARFLGWIIE